VGVPLHGSGVAAMGALRRDVRRVKNVAGRILKVEGCVLEALVREASEGRARRLHLASALCLRQELEPGNRGGHQSRRALEAGVTELCLSMLQSACSCRLTGM
jgi:hypothetical protein